MNLLNRLLSVLLALALVADGLGAVGWSALHAAGVRSAAFDDAVAAVRLSGPRLQAACVLLALAGLLLLIGELAVRAPRRLRLGEGGPVTWWADRASAERAFARVVEERTPAGRAQVRVRERAAGWWVRVRAAGPAGLAPEVDQEVRDLLRRLGRPAGATIEVRMRRGGRAV